ncbi:MAG: glycosyltransferase, partial [Bdellovibrionales bacterium]
AMMVATQSLEDTLRGWGFKNPIHRLIRGANLDVFHPGEKTLFKDLKPPIALYVGRIAIEKSVEDFLDMPWDGTKVIVGDGPDRAELERKYPAARFVGKKTGADLAAHYRSADLFVFPSRTDTFGIVLVEALASGLPVAAYNVTGPKDIITADFLGALDETNLKAAADKALSSGTPEQRSRHVKDHYTWKNASRQYEDALINKVK